MKMDFKINDTYLGHALSCDDRRVHEIKMINEDVRKDAPLVPDGSKFLTIDEMAELVKNTKLGVCDITSLGTWKRKEDGLFVLQNMSGNEEGNEEILFQEQNASVLNYPGEILPRNINALAQISSYNPDRFLPFLKKHKDRFVGMKIFAAMPIPVDDEKFNDIWKFCEMQNWPVTVHCDGSLKSFLAVFVAAQKFSNVKFIASHLGGINSKTTDRILLIKKLNKNFPQNLFFNTATPDYDSIKKMAEILPEKIVHASDVPFCKLWGNETSIEKSVIEHYEKVQNILNKK